MPRNNFLSRMILQHNGGKVFTQLCTFIARTLLKTELLLILHVFVSLQWESKLKAVKREIFLPVKQLVLIDKYTPSIRFWSLTLFC